MNKEGKKKGMASVPSKLQPIVDLLNEDSPVYYRSFIEYMMGVEEEVNSLHIRFQGQNIRILPLARVVFFTKDRAVLPACWKF